MKMKQNRRIQITKNQPSLPSVPPNPSPAPSHNPIYIRGLNRPESMHLFNIPNNPQLWSI